MDLFKPEDPSLRELIAYVVAQSLQRDAVLTQTKLVKLLYLIDVARAERRRRPLTGVPWVFFHYGPYSFPLAEELGRMEGAEIAIRRLPPGRAEREVALYVGASSASDAGGWPPATKMLVDHVVDRWALVPLNEVLDFVYFRTEPMRIAVRGEPLDLSQVQSAPLREYRPLRAPERWPDADDRIRHWLERRRRGSLRGALDPPPRYDAEYWRAMRASSGYPEGDPADEIAARGQLEVSENVEV